jgi:glucose-1-phosphate thymidylyltransferase
MVDRNLKTIIPVAGVGSRLRPHTFTNPKVLLNVAGKPILGHILDHLQGAGIRQVTLIVGPMRDLIEKYVRDNHQLDATFIPQEDPRGLGHAVSLGLSDNDKDVLIILGDTIFDFDLATILQTSETSTIGVREVADPRRFGVVEVEDGRVSRLVEKPEKPKSNLVIAGIYLIRNAPALRRSIGMLFDRGLTTQGEYQLTDALQLMIEQGEPIRTFVVDGWYDCGKVETLLETNRYLLDKDPACRAPVSREKTVLIPEGAVVKDAMVRDSILGEGAQVIAALVERSLVGSKARIVGHFHRFNVGDSSEVLLGSTRPTE